MINNANIDVLLMRFIHVVMEKRKTIKFRFVGSNKIKQVDYVDSTADVKVTDFNGWSSENEKLKHFQPKVNRTLVNLTEKNEPEEKKTRPRSTKSKSKDKRDIRVVYDHDVRQQQHKNPFMNELIQILNRHEPSTISNYRSAVTQKLISIFNLENDYNKQNQPPTLIVRTPTPVLTDHRLDAMRYFQNDEPERTQRKKTQKAVLPKTNTQQPNRAGHKLPEIGDFSILGGAIKTKSLLPSIRPLK